MVGFELFEKFTRRPNFSIFHVFQTLTDAFFRIDASGDVLQLFIINVPSNICHSRLLIKHFLGVKNTVWSVDSDGKLLDPVVGQTTRTYAAGFAGALRLGALPPWSLR